MERLTDVDVGRIFAYYRIGDEDRITKDDFLRLIRYYMKAVKEIVITDTLAIKESKTLRRADIGEILEVLEGPVDEGNTDLRRVRAKAMADNVEGWVTVESTKGSQFLVEGGSTYKVVKETILTDAFDLSDTADKEKSMKLKDVTRKLKPDGLVDVLEWPRKDEQSGITRMQCRTKTDALVGWATTVGNSGIVFLEVV